MTLKESDAKERQTKTENGRDEAATKHNNIIIAHRLITMLLTQRTQQS